MTVEIITISLPMPMNLGNVNCYLIRKDKGCILVDTGAPSTQTKLERELDRLGCRPADLRLIVITHGDFDHIGSAAYLRKKFDTKIAMHPDDAGMAEHADMFWNRGKGNILVRTIVPALFGFSSKARFSPDVLVQDGFDLCEYGLQARVLSIPGHSKGSIGILTSSGDFLCGDLLMNDQKDPALGFGNPAAFQASLLRLKGIEIKTIYPGHGKPFPASTALWDALIERS